MGDSAAVTQEQVYRTRRFQQAFVRVSLVRQSPIGVPHQGHRHATADTTTREICPGHVTQGMENHFAPAGVMQRNACRLQIAPEAFNAWHPSENEIIFGCSVGIQSSQFCHQFKMQMHFRQLPVLGGGSMSFHERHLGIQMQVAPFERAEVSMPQPS